MRDSFNDSLMLIGGERVAALKDTWLECINPATEEVIGRVPSAGPEDFDLAVVAADKAFSDWSSRRPYDRAMFLRCLASRLGEETERLADLEVRDTGITIGTARFDIESAIEAR